MIEYFQGDIMDKIEEIKVKLAKAAHRDVIKDDDKLRELGLDSLDVVELLLQLEEDYGVHFDDLDMAKMNTVGDLLGLIKDQLK